MDLRRELCKHLADTRDYIYVSNNPNFFTFLYLYFEHKLNTTISLHCNDCYFYFQPLLKSLIGREGYTYKQVVENLHRGLYIPYTITAKALRLFTNIPYVYYKCKIVSDPRGKKDAKMLKLHETWPVTSDEDLPEIKHLEYFNNRRDYILSINLFVMLPLGRRGSTIPLKDTIPLSLRWVF